jgi:hypothetical protein
MTELRNLEHVDKQKIYDHLKTMSKSIIDFKKKNLSLTVEGNHPVLKIGESTSYVALKEQMMLINHMKIFKSKSKGFNEMSEVWLPGDYSQLLLHNDDPEITEILRKLSVPVIEEIRESVEAVLNDKIVVFNAIIDTINSNTCILPHSDGYYRHFIGFRIHVPLFTSSRSYGVNFHPYRTSPYFWRMQNEGNIYIFNNFEPHTVLKMEDEAQYRSHLICDVGIKGWLDGLSDMEKTVAKTLLLTTGPNTTKDFSPCFITHTISNLRIRNRLGMHYGGMFPVESYEENFTPEYFAGVRKWTRNLFEYAEANNLIHSI